MPVRIRSLLASCVFLTIQVSANLHAQNFQSINQRQIKFDNPGSIESGSDISLSDSILVFKPTEIGLSDTLYLTLMNQRDTLILIQDIFCNVTQFLPAFSDSLIEAADSLVIPVYFKPDARGEFNGTLIIETTDSLNNSISCALSGIGIASEISLSSTFVDFGIISQGDTAVQQIVISNIGEIELQVDSLIFEKEENSAFFTFFNDTSISSNSSVVIDIYYSDIPQIENIFTDTVSIYSSDPLSNKTEISLKSITYRKFYISEDFATIQTGIDSIWHNDTLILSPGIYQENINYNGKNITLASYYISTLDTSYITNTVVDGRQNGSVVKFENNEDSTAVLSGLTIQNGEAESGAGIYIYGSSPRISHVRIVNNSSNDGAGLYCEEANPRVYNVAISNNSADNGGGVFLKKSSPRLENLLISGNSALYAGAGICCSDHSYPYIYGTNIVNNIGGGGVCCGEFTGPVMQNCLIKDNQADSGGGMGCGGPCQPVLSHVIFSGNRASKYGGGLRADFDVTLSLSNVTFEHNISEREGGAISCENFSKISITNGLIINNEAYAGGGAIDMNSSELTLINTTITKNLSADTTGSIIFSLNSQAIIFNSILWDNKPENLIFSDIWDAAITVVSSNIKGGRSSIVTGSGDIVHYMENNLDSDPRFSNPDADDFHLENESPCIGCGLDSILIGEVLYQSPANDIEDNPRPYPMNSHVDLGAFESPLGLPTDIQQVRNTIPLKFILCQNFPNPFNASTQIEYSIPVKSKVRIFVYDILGRITSEILNELKQAGTYSIIFEDYSLASGIYIYCIEALNPQTGRLLFKQFKKMILTK